MHPETRRLLQFSDATLRVLIFGILAEFLFPSCASQELLTRRDYHPAVEALQSNGPAEALRLFPAGEETAFIPLMEKTYLNLLQGKPEIDALQAYASRIEGRLRIKVSDELAFLFYMETPEGYYASEHEIIWMHMLLSWGYSLRGSFEDAAIEARKSALLLEGKSREGRFDDPMLRIVLAALWTMCDRWEDARVDFRMAARMDPSLRWAAALADRDAPPDQLALVLTGVGPEPYWKPEMQLNPLRGLRDLEFISPAENQSLQAYDANGRWLPVNISPDSGHWYRRHMQRNNEIHKLIDDSRYGQLVVYSTAKGGVKAGLGITAGIVVATLSIAVGGAIMYYGHDSSEIVGLGLGIAVAGTSWSIDFATDTVKSSYETAMEEMDISDRYRYVRFLPTRARLILGSGDRPIRLLRGNTQIQVEPDVTNGTRTSIRYLSAPP